MTKIALVFPGQGSQVVGMGKALFDAYPVARSVMEAVQAATQPDLLQVCFEGPDTTLINTTYTQPGLLAVSLGALAAVKAQYPNIMAHVVVTAGHSLGEYGALVAADVLTAEAAARLVGERARLMSQASAGAMAVVLGLKAEAVEAVLKQLDGVLVVANDNSPEQVVISGEPVAVQSATEPLKAAGAKRVMPLAVSGAFHSPLMHTAAEQFKTAIAKETFANAHIPVITNIDAEPTVAGHADKLSAQIEQGVRWTATMQRMVAQYEVDTLIELGSGKVLTGLMKKAHSQVNSLSVGDPDGVASLQAVLESVSQGNMAHVG